MLEIHYHLLHGVDDGPRKIEDSIALAEASIQEGVTHIVSTPHSNDQFQFSTKKNRERLEELKARLGDRVTLGLGCDFQLSDENLQAFDEDPTQFTINGGKYLLVEFSDFGIPRCFTDALARMIDNHFIPVITHPERNPILAAEQSRVAEFIRMGCVVQITAGSLTGRFGSEAQNIVNGLIKKNWVHLVASDAHSMDFRPPELRPAYRAIERHFGVETAERLCVQNPTAVFHGNNLARQPKPVGVDEQSEERPRGFMSRMFRLSSS